MNNIYIYIYRFFFAGAELDWLACRLAGLPACRHVGLQATPNLPTKIIPAKIR